MQRLLVSSASFLLIFTSFSLGCRNSESKSSGSSTAFFSCVYTRDGAVALCTQYQDLSGSTLTAIHSECEARSAEGFSWTTAACAASTIGTCALPATAQKPAVGTQSYYGEGFASSGAASGMCSAQGGTFKPAS